MQGRNKVCVVREAEICIGGFRTRDLPSAASPAFPAHSRASCSQSPARQSPCPPPRRFVIGASWRRPQDPPRLAALLTRPRTPAIESPPYPTSSRLLSRAAGSQSAECIVLTVSIRTELNGRAQAAVQLLASRYPVIAPPLVVSAQPERLRNSIAVMGPSRNSFCVASPLGSAVHSVATGSEWWQWRARGYCGQGKWRLFSQLQVASATRLAPEGTNVQIARHRRTRQRLCRNIRRAVLVRLAEPSRVDKPQRPGVVEQRVEHRPRVEQRYPSEVAVSCLEGADIRGKLRVVIFQHRRNLSHHTGPLLEKQRCTVRRRHRQKEE